MIRSGPVRNEWIQFSVYSPSFRFQIDRKHTARAEQTRTTSVLHTSHTLTQTHREARSHLTARIHTEKHLRSAHSQNGTRNKKNILNLMKCNIGRTDNRTKCLRILCFGLCLCAHVRGGESPPHSIRLYVCVYVCTYVCVCVHVYGFTHAFCRSIRCRT